jgi:phosphatidylserine/phosphatidylglycerophosphate/cardiolipin synthase-like enzyme
VARQKRSIGEHKLNDIEILATGSEFVKGGVRGIEPVIEEIIMKAEKEIQIIAYLFTVNTLHLISLLEKAAKKGIKITIVVNRLQIQSSPIKLKLDELSKFYSNINIIDFIDPQTSSWKSHSS